MPCRYTGNEPSPKGNGFCAHEGVVGTIRVGRDGNRWAIVTDKNGRQRWQAKKATKSPQTKTKKAVTKTKAVKKPSSMPEAKALWTAVKAMSDDDRDSKVYGSAANPSVLYVPQKNLKVRYATPSSKGVKGFIVGQPGVSNKLGLIFSLPRETGVISVVKSKKNFYKAGKYLVTGSGADPVFEII